MKSTVQIELDFPGLVQTYQAMVWRYLRLMGCESALAEDLTQEVFLSVYRKPFVQVSEAATSGYLRTLARNQYVDWLRRHNKRVSIDFDQVEHVWSEVEQQGDGGNRWLESLRECVDSLEKRARRIVELRYHDQLPIRKVADELGMKESGVKTLLGRLKNRLRECVERKVSTT